MALNLARRHQAPWRHEQLVRDSRQYREIALHDAPHEIEIQPEILVDNLVTHAAVCHQGTSLPVNLTVSVFTASPMISSLRMMTSCPHGFRDKHLAAGLCVRENAVDRVANVLHVDAVVLHVGQRGVASASIRSRR